MNLETIATVVLDWGLHLAADLLRRRVLANQSNFLRWDVSFAWWLCWGEPYVRGKLGSC